MNKLSAEEAEFYSVIRPNQTARTSIHYPEKASGDLKRAAAFYCLIFHIASSSKSLALIITIYAPMMYTAPCCMHNVLDACISITRGSGRGLGPGIREFFGPCEMASSR
jgi:hypothetical protein